MRMSLRFVLIPPLPPLLSPTACLSAASGFVLLCSIASMSLPTLSEDSFLQSHGP